MDTAPETLASPWIIGLYYLLVAAFGLCVGAAELASRYRDEPVAVLHIPAAWLYVTVNAVASLFAFWIVRSQGWTFGDGPGPEIRQALAAGFGAMALFRSSLFTVRVGDTDVQVGPAGFLQILLATADRTVDRARANIRAADIGRIMQAVRFEKAVEALTEYCKGLMQNLSATDRERLDQEIGQITASSMSDHLKAQRLGLTLMGVVGTAVLETAVDALGDRIKGGASRSEIVSELMEGIDFDRAAKPLPAYAFALHADVSPEMQAEFQAGIDALAQSGIDPEIKTLQLGLALLDLVGEDNLRASVDALGTRLQG